MLNSVPLSSLDLDIPGVPSSNISHLDEITYNTQGSPNRLMTPSGTPGDRCHAPGPIAIGLMKDLGWANVPNPSAPVQATLRSPTGVLATGALTYQWLPLKNASDYQLRIVKTPTNGIVSQTWVQASDAQCSTGTCSLKPTITLPSGKLSILTLPSGNYRWDIQAKGAGGTGAWSRVMIFTVK